MKRSNRMHKPLAGLMVSSLIFSSVSVPGHSADAEVYKDQRPVSEANDSGRLVVSMGDSYSAGEGIEPFFGDRFTCAKLLKDWMDQKANGSTQSLDNWLTDESRKTLAVFLDDWLAHRSQKSWSAQLNVPGLGELGYQKYTGEEPANWYFVAASGAVTWNVFDKQEEKFTMGDEKYERNLDAQIHTLEELNRENRVPDYVTLTLGGNDVGFQDVITTAAIQSSYLFPTALDANLQDALTKLDEDYEGLKGKEESQNNPNRVTESVRTRLKKTYKAISDAAQIGDKKPCILVAGYPHLLNDGWNKYGRNITDLYTNLTILDPGDAYRINSKIDYFNGVLEEIVRNCKSEGLNIEYIDVGDAFKGHEPYTVDPWINGILGSAAQDLNFLPPVSAYSIHPNEDGARLGYAACVQAKINELEAKRVQEQEDEGPTAISVTTDPLAEYDVVTFGRYEIDGNEQNGKEEIEWIVLEDDGEEMLLMSKEALDEKPYNEKYTMSVTWEQCSLRNWLNNDFYNTAFSGEEKNMIVLSDVENVDNPNGTDGGSSTKDRVYLLSIDEASWYLPTDDMRRSEATVYAVKNGVSVHAFDNCGWWLRSPGTYASEAADVTSTGAVRSTGLYVSNNCNGVRPVIRVKKSAVIPPYLNDDGYLVFGHYEQDGNTENGKEPIEWMILDENENGKLLISKYVLDCVPFNNKYEDVTWETCSLREWLNNDFLNEAFSKAEQTLIPKVHLKNSGVEMPGGNATEDQIFCLSLEEVAKYYEVELDKYAFFGFCKELITLPTEYAKANGLHTFRAKDCIDEPIGDEYWMDGYAPKGYQASITDLAGTYWWLRTMGWDTDVCAVFPNGYAGPHYESGVSSGGYGVRPVLYLKQDSEEVVEKSKLYDAFLRNEATAHFRKDADDTQQFNIKKKLSDGRAYTLDDILKLATKGWGDSISFGEPQYKYIDCGLDGVKELLVSIPVNTYAEDFTIDMIVKDIKGELSICYVCDEWSRSHTMITDSGMIVNGGSGGASSGSVEKSFVDKDGAWKKWYKRFEEGSPSSVVFNGSSVNLTDLDLESLALVKYTVDDETYCCLEQYLGREPVTPQSTVDTVKARLKKVGMKIYSSEEIETILTERKKALGLEDEIVSYKLSGT